MIEGTSVAKNGAFKRIYASSFYYDSDGVAEWPAQVVNYDSAPPALISQIKYLRFNGDEYASALSTLLRSLRKQFSK